MGWGSCLEHEIGWRCQYMQVIAIGGAVTTPRNLKLLGLRYEVPAFVDARALFDYAESYPLETGPPLFDIDWKEKDERDSK